MRTTGRTRTLRARITFRKACPRSNGTGRPIAASRRRSARSSPSCAAATRPQERRRNDRHPAAALQPRRRCRKARDARWLRSRCCAVPRVEGRRKEVQTLVETLQAERNQIAKQIGQAKAKGENASELLKKAELGKARL